MIRRRLLLLCVLPAFMPPPAGAQGLLPTLLVHEGPCPGGALGAVACHEGALYTTCSENDLHSMDAASGEPIASYPIPVDVFSMDAHADLLVLLTQASPQHLLQFDLVAKGFVGNPIPVPGERSYLSVSFDGDGAVWLFSLPVGGPWTAVEVSLEDGSLVSTRDFDVVPFLAGSFSWASHDLWYRGSFGTYRIDPGFIFADPVGQWDSEIIPSSFGLDFDGEALWGIGSTNVSGVLTFFLIRYGTEPTGVEPLGWGDLKVRLGGVH